MVGPWVADNAIFTLQGLVAGGALTILGGISMRSGLPPVVTRFLFGTAGGAISFGAGFDLYNYLTERSDEIEGEEVEEEIDADIAEELEVLEGLDEDLAGLALGGLALTNGIMHNGQMLGGLALENGVGRMRPNGQMESLGDGFSYQLAPLSTGDTGIYGQASLMDASLAGDDFSVDEGHALANGRDHYMRRFPVPRFAGSRKTPHSHMAGRPGLRWGWLIKMIGFEKAQAIARMPPAQRVATLRKMRQAAIQAFQQQQLLESAQTVEVQSQTTDDLQPAAGSVSAAPNGAMGASGPGGFLGDPMVFTR
jgi:hypothetical protein